MAESFIGDADIRALVTDAGLLSSEQLALVERRAEEKGESLTASILWYGFVSDEELGRLVADFLHIPFVSLANLSLSEDVVAIVPGVVAKKQKIVAFRKDEQGLHIATSDPENRQFFDFLERKTGLPVTVWLATDRDIENAIATYSRDTSVALGKLTTLSEGSADDETRIISLVDEVVSHAFENRASDIHIEPGEDVSTIRFRIDGILHDITTITREIHTQVISRIKVLSKLRTDEHQVPQDGKMRFVLNEEPLDVRVSIVPVTEGEKAVLRLLSERSRQFSIETLGLSDPDFETIRLASERPHGCILSTGPTGCGKTTTLYALLKVLNDREVNIMTIEDPVEYDMEGVNQMQVNPKTNLTFATGLRSILRQDPNVILVGEIRDKETAEIAVQLAMTGHLVLSTLHTNDAATAIPRLTDMDVEPFLIASSVNVIIAQRLIRKIHSGCRVSEEIPYETIREKAGDAITEKLFGSKKESIRLYRGKGCPACHNTGFDGRIGIFEVLSVDDAVQKAILDRKPASIIRDIAIAAGMRSMFEDGLEKVRGGVTTIDEILRVTRE